MKAKKSAPRSSTTSPRSAPPKSSPITKPASQFKQQWHALARPWRSLLTIGGFTLLWLFASYVLFRRFPNNYRQPNFYAEDGPLFGRTLAEHGLLHALGTTFNGYYIAGIYLIEQTANILNHLFGGGEFVNLPRALSMASYSFLGFCVTLPALLLRRYVQPAALAIITLLLLFVPLRGTDYVVLGTIGHLKFAFVFVAFILLLYRHFSPEGNRKILLVDFALLICAYTNITVYLLLPFALLRYLPKLKAKDRWQQLYQDQTMRSLVVLGVLLLPQLYFIHRDGIPTLAGYLDEPYQKRSTIELFIARPYFYGLLFPIYRHLNDLLVMLMFVITAVGGWFYAGKYRSTFVFSVVAVFITTSTFVLKRTGISQFHIGYHGGGFDQFFYTQNWIFETALVLAAAEFIRRFAQRWLQLAAYGLTALIIVFGIAPRSTAIGAHNFMEKEVGSIYQEAKQDCASNASEFDLDIYPNKDQHYDDVSRQTLCTNSVYSH